MKTLHLFTILCLSISLAYSYPLYFKQSVSLSGPIRDYKEIPIHVDAQGNHYIHTLPGNEGPLNDYIGMKEADTHQFNKMVLNLYSNETFIAGCGNFKMYQEKNHTNFLTGAPEKTVHYFYNKKAVSGPQVHIDLQTSAFRMINLPAIYARRCDNNFKAPHAGYLGLGSGENFITKMLTNFSIFLSNGNDHMTSALYLGGREHLSQYYGSQENVLNVNVGKNWAMKVADIEVTLNDENYTQAMKLPEQYNIMFDLNTKDVNIPVKIFRIMTKLLEAYGVVCTEKSSKCEFETNLTLSQLPTFSLIVENNTTKTNSISLTPDFYFNKTGSKLNIKPINPEDVSSEYANTIILGEIFMQNHLIHFTQGQGKKPSTLTIEKAPHTMKDSSLIAWLIGGLIVGSLAIISCIALTWYQINFRETEAKKIVLEFDYNDEDKHEKGSQCSDEDVEYEYFEARDISSGKVFKMEEMNVGAN